MLSGKDPDRIKQFPDGISIREIDQEVADLRVRHTREERRHDPESAYAKTLNRFQRLQQVAGIIQADAGQLAQLIVSTQRRQRFGCGCPERNRLIVKQAAEAKTHKDSTSIIPSNSRSDPRLHL
jgi:hypothetical protein